MRIAIVGGGISGASVAFLLNSRGSLDIELIEPSHIGGKALSLHESGYLVESGPNGFLDNKEEILRLIDECGFGDEVIESRDEARRRYIYCCGKLHAVPNDPFAIIKGDLLGKLAILRVVRELFVAPVLSDETLASFVIRRLGKEMLDKLIGPMASGVYAGDPWKMSMDATFGRIKEIERRYGSLIVGLVRMMLDKRATTKSASGPFSAKLLSFKRGVGSFVCHLVNGINVLQDRVVGIERVSGKYRLFLELSGGRIYDSVVFAVPSWELSAIVAGFDRDFSKLLQLIEYAPMAVVAMGFDRRHMPDLVESFGYLFSLSSIRDVIGVLFDSSIFEHRAPKGKVLVRLMVGGAMRKRAPFRSDLVGVAVSELQRSAGIFAPFEWSTVIRHPKAIPQYDMNHSRVIAGVEEFEGANSGLFVTGNAFYGVSLNDCVASAYRVVERIVN